MIGFLPNAELSSTPVADLLSSFPKNMGEVIVAMDFAYSTLLPKILGSDNKKWTKALMGKEANHVFEGDALLDVYTHSSVPLEEGVVHNWLCQIPVLAQGQEPAKVFADLGGTTANFYAFSNGKLELANALEVRSKEDLLYHLGNICEQLNWDRSNVEVELSGISHKSMGSFIKPYFSIVQYIQVGDYLKVSSALNTIDIASYGALLRL